MTDVTTFPRYEVESVVRAGNRYQITLFSSYGVPHATLHDLKGHYWRFRTLAQAQNLVRQLNSHLLLAREAGSKGTFR